MKKIKKGNYTSKLWLNLKTANNLISKTAKMNKYTINAILVNVDVFYKGIFENYYVELALRYDLIEKMSKE